MPAASRLHATRGGEPLLTTPALTTIATLAQAVATLPMDGLVIAEINSGVEAAMLCKREAPCGECAKVERLERHRIEAHHQRLVVPPLPPANVELMLTSESSSA